MIGKGSPFVSMAEACYKETMNMTIGALLRQAREEMGMGEEEIASELQIPLKVIQALENDDSSRLPAKVYSRGFLKKYADRLELDSLSLLAQFDREWQSPTSVSSAGARPHDIHAFSLFAWHRFSFLTQQKIVLFCFLASLTTVSVYFFYEFRFMIGRPLLVISSPQTDLVTNADSIPVSGRIEKEATLMLNGRPIYTNEQGEFQDGALLRKGLNALEFEVANRLGKTNKVVRYILVK